MTAAPSPILTLSDDDGIGAIPGVGGLPFEPTGQLQKDYIAYCEIDECEERGEILGGIGFDQTTDEAGQSKVRTTFFVRNVDGGLNRTMMSPLASSIPHCYNLRQIRFSSTGMTDVAFKLLVQAIWKSASVVSVWVDFNKDGLVKDPEPDPALVPEYFFPHRTGGCMPRSVLEPNKDAGEQGPKLQELFVLYPGEMGCGGFLPPPPEQPDNNKAKADAKPKTAKKGGRGLPEDEVQAPKYLVIPNDFSAILMTRLQDLSLRANNTDDAQLGILCHALETHIHLKSINLWGNMITDGGAPHIANTLRVNRTLTAVNLGHNRLSDVGAQMIANAFRPMVVTRQAMFEARKKVRQHINAAGSSSVSASVGGAGGVSPPPPSTPGNLMSEEEPPYPYYEDVARTQTGNTEIPVPRRVEVQPLGGQTPGGPGQKKDAKAAKAPKKGSGVLEPGQRPPGTWDEDVLRMTEHLYVIPGNTTLWSLNLSNNLGMTDTTSECFSKLFSGPFTLYSTVRYAPPTPATNGAEGEMATPSHGPRATAPTADKKKPPIGKAPSTLSPREGAAPVPSIEDLPIEEWPLYRVGEVGSAKSQLDRLLLQNTAMSVDKLQVVDRALAKHRSDRKASEHQALLAAEQQLKVTEGRGRSRSRASVISNQ